MEEYPNKSKPKAINFVVILQKAFFTFMFLLFPNICQTIADETAGGYPMQRNEDVKGEIEVWAWNIAAASIKEVLPLFNEYYPNVKVNVNMNQTQIQSRFLLSLSSGVGAPDVTQFLISETQRYAATKRMMDLTYIVGKYEKDFIPSFWSNVVYENRVYAVPWGAGPCAVFYKRHIFDKYGIDPNTIETWSDYLDTGKVIYGKSSGKTKLFHFSTAGVPSGLDVIFEMLIQQNGGQVFDHEGRIAINSQQCLQAVRILRKIYDSKVTSNEPLYSHAHYASLNNDTVATYPTAAWWGGTIKDYAPGTSGDWGVFKLPAIEHGGIRTSNLGGSSLAIPDQSKQKEAAAAFIEFVLCRPEIQNIQYEKFDLIPCLLSSFKDPMYKEPDPFFANQKVRKLFIQDIEKITPLNRNKDWLEAIGYLSSEFSRWAARKMEYSEEQVLIRVEKKMHKRLKRDISPISLMYQNNNN